VSICGVTSRKRNTLEIMTTVNWSIQHEITPFLSSMEYVIRVAVFCAFHSEIAIIKKTLQPQWPFWAFCLNRSYGYSEAPRMREVLLEKLLLVGYLSQSVSQLRGFCSFRFSTNHQPSFDDHTRSCVRAETHIMSALVQMQRGRQYGNMRGEETAGVLLFVCLAFCQLESC